MPKGQWERLAQAKLRSEALVNVGRNYNGPKVAKFLVGEVVVPVKMPDTCGRTERPHEPLL